MRHLHLSLTATSPLAIRADHAQGGSQTARYIPGTTLRGSLAAVHHMLHPDQKEEFAQLFLEERVWYPHLYPAHFQTSDEELEKLNRPVKPLPKTASQCKRFSGFSPVKGEKDTDERHGVHDSLLDWVIFSLLDAQGADPATLLTALEHQRICPYAGCQRPLDRAEGYYRSSPYDSQLRMAASSRTRLQTRTGINRDWGVVEEGIFYNREVFDEGMVFWGELLFPDERHLSQEQQVLSRFLRLIQEANKEKPGLISIGTGRSRGLGRVYVNPDQEQGELVEEERETLPAFQKRLETFNAVLQDHAAKRGVRKGDAFYFAITLSSAAILRDSFLRYQKTLDAATLGQLLRPAPGMFTQIYQATGLQRIAGWNDLLGTPRSNDYALEAGSVFVFASHTQPDKQLFQALHTLEETGLGLRRTEGFGRICISDIFHHERAGYE